MIKVMFMNKNLYAILIAFIFISGCTGVLDAQTDQDQETVDQLKQETTNEKIKALQQEIDEFCKSKCPGRESILAQKTEYCVSYYIDSGTEEMDLDGDGTTDGVIAGLSEDTLFCEDKIFCPAYYECEGIDAKDCTGIILEYFSETARLDDIAEIRRRLSHPQDRTYEDVLVLPGTCYENLSESQKEKHWFTALIQ